MNLSPVKIINENEIEFYLHGKSFTVNTTENTVVENETISEDLYPLAWAVENFQFIDNKIVWYKGVHKMYYDITESKFYMGNTEILNKDFTNFTMASGVIRYDEKAIAESFEHAANNAESFVILDFVKTINENGNLIDVMKLGENVYISRINESAKIYNFFKANTANAAVEYVNEKTNVNITEFVADLVEGELTEYVDALDEINKKEGLIAFLKDQRNTLAEADKSIEEINDADALIEGEITKFETEIKELKAKL
jgi:hypothetical protein